MNDREKIMSYMAKGEGVCWKCGSPTEGDSFDCEGPYVSQNIFCNHCEKEWRLNFRLETVACDGVSYKYVDARKPRYRLVNLQTRKYMDVDDEQQAWEGEWKERYEHTAGFNWADVHAYCLRAFNTVDGMYYVQDLCNHGGLFTLLADKDKDSPEKIQAACQKLRKTYDVVSLTVLELTEVPAA